MNHLIFESLRYSSFGQYSPRGVSAISKKSREFCYSIKNADRGLIEKIAKKIQSGANDFESLMEVFASDAVLVPVPRSAPLVDGGLWPARLICEIFVKNGLGGSVQELLERVCAVPKSAFAARGERPSIETHIKSLEISRQGYSISGSKIVLVDDVVTKGRTLLACASKLKPLNLPVEAFAVVRTMGFAPNVDQIACAVSCGHIRFNSMTQDADRSP